jgi:hypothetical protein
MGRREGDGRRAQSHAGEEEEKKHSFILVFFFNTAMLA